MWNLSRFITRQKNDLFNNKLSRINKGKKNIIISHIQKVNLRRKKHPPKNLKDFTCATNNF